jgi:hypothetical protein
MARQSLAREMVDRGEPSHEPVDDVERAPEPAERPHPRAQWDEVKGEWVVWDDDDERWEDVDDPGAPKD